MLMLTVLLVILPFLHQGTSINLTYILKKQNDKLEPSCLAQDSERYRGVGWVYPIPENESQIPHITTKFIPEITNDYNCDFSKNNDCNLNWSMRDWELDEDSLKTYNFLGDERWEDLPTIFTSKGSKDFNVQVPNAFRLGFSVRSGNPVDLQICSGWNPKNYPCFYVKIDIMSAHLEKHNGQVTATDSKPLDSYTAFTKIISDDEWRNFIISYNENGELNLFDVNKNRTILKHKESNLKPLYFIPNSEKPALWKIHQNHFLYTKLANTYRLGKPIRIPSKDMCISLHISTCDGCEMIFFTLGSDVSKQILNQVQPTGEFQWREVKLKQQNVDNTKTIFVETVLRKGANSSLGFWAIDNVRFCHENEVKVSYLDNVDKLKLKNNTDFISCQIISQPEWRPKKLTYDNVKDFPNIVPSQTKNSISLKWNDEDPNHQTSYFISYQGNDICSQAPHNFKRIKSNGFLSSNYNQITIENLEPYTKYNIVISSVLHEMDKKLEVTTLEEDFVTFFEFPRVKLQANDTYVALSWEPVDCKNVYGHVMYSLTVSNKTRNFLKELKLQTEYAYQINGLEPFTQYQINIKMGRKPEDLEHSSSTVFEQFFTTLAGAAPSVQNLEIYAIGKSKAFLRYDLPKEMRGVPSNIKVDKCNALSFKKCKPIFMPVEHCTIWPEKYCIKMSNLLEHQQYNFKVSLKNYNTVTYGKEVSVSGYTKENVPGSPSNISYQIVDCQNQADYCNINVSWLHPYNQNSTITSFIIKMNGTKNLSKTDEHEQISEVYKIINDTYLPKYTYQIKYIPYSTTYDLSVQSVNNGFKSDVARTSITTDDIGDHIDQSPTVVAKCDHTVVFNLPDLDRRLDHYELTVVVQDDKDVEVDQNLPEKVVENLCRDTGNTWIAKKIKVTDNTTKTITIGEADELDKISKVNNKPLTPNSRYCFVFIITNSYRNSEHDVVYSETTSTASCVKEAGVVSNSSPKSKYALLLLLLIIPVGFLVYWYIKRRRRPTVKDNQENVYESLPFEECEDNSVNNMNYDTLLHK
ncbi:unnamed protein product [Brassicogethes aeneus]|uniref:Fibronectin type-III domain-containing protein n=1 Tax=Brassicogethes aeneus TaxID=1431903 RepID=A0A9P0FE32_BRAAE|nr:unnamed protein product [Brassicogethes aeneus]